MLSTPTARWRGRANTLAEDELSDFEFRREVSLFELGRGLVRDATAPCDCLPVSSSLHRVLGDDTPGAKRDRSALDLGGLADLSRPSFRQTICLVFLFVALDVSKSFAVSWAAVHGHMCAPLAICAKNACSIVVGMLLASWIDGREGVRQCMDVKMALPVLPIAGCFCAAQLFALQALRAFDPGSLKIMSQVNLPTTAVLSWLVLNRQYSTQQWYSTALLLFATVAFLQVRMLFFTPPDNVGNQSWQAKPDKALGMLHVLLSIALSCSASIFAERFLKKFRDVPFYIQKTNLMLGELASALFMVWLSLQSSSSAGSGLRVSDMCSWEQIWGWQQIPVVLVWMGHGWIAGLLVKRCSALVKNISHILSAMVTYFMPLLFVSGTQHFWPVTLSAVLVLLAVLVHATVPRGEAPRQRPSLGGESAVAVEPGKPEQPLLRGSRLPSPLAALRARSTSECLLTAAAAQGGKDQHELPLPPPLPRISASRWHSVWFLLFAFIVLDALKPILVTWAHQNKAPEERFINGTFVLVQTSLSLCVGLIIAVRPQISLSPLGVELHPKWQKRLCRCVDRKSVIHQLPVSLCLCLSKLFLVMALEHLDAGAVRVFGQASLPLVGVGTAVFFAKRYTAQQWWSLMAISLALVTFYYVKAEVAEKKESSGGAVHHFEVVGVMLVIAAISFNCLGALLVEKFLKRGHSRVHEQKSQLLLGEVVINAAILVIVPYLADTKSGAALSVWRRGFFAGWDRRVFICAIIWIPAGWTSTILVKRCSNVLKMIAQGAASVLTYVLASVPLSCGPRWWICFVQVFGPALNPEPFSWPVVLLAITVMLAALTFGSDSDHTRPARKVSGPATSEEDGRHEAGVSNWHVDKSYGQLAKRPRGR